MSLEDLFGSGRELTALQMSVRALVCFFTLLALTRLAGMRAFGRKSTFDVVIVITLGAVLSRMIVGVSPALPTIAAAIVLVALHRIIAVVTAAVPALERIIKGDSHVIYRGGIFDVKRMRRAGISRADIEQAVRKHANQLSLREVLEVRLEPTGELTVIEDEVGRRNRAERNKGLGVPAGAPM
jgi:uncharacterized membrane protein YcaP (DUF421 family)